MHSPEHVHEYAILIEKGMCNWIAFMLPSFDSALCTLSTHKNTEFKYCVMDSVDFHISEFIAVSVNTA